MKGLVVVCAVLLLNASVEPAATSVTPVAFPFGHATSAPYVVAEGKGAFAVSWLDRDTKSFNFARYDGSKWSGTAQVIARGNLFENAADYPSIAAEGRTIFAQWRERVGGDGTRILLARSDDGGATWSKAVSPHPALEREFGFVSILPLANGSARVIWLDGRASAHEGEGATQLRGATMTPAGTLADQVLIDERVCDCCQTAMTMSARGPLVVYRDRSANEVRDIMVALPVSATHGNVVHADNWMIRGCPVNGPRVDARDRNVAVAWFTAAGGQQAVNVAFSRDAGLTFGPPTRVDTGHGSGRADVVLLDDGGSAVVTWTEHAGVYSNVMARQVSATGIMAPLQKLGRGRSTGFPRIARSNGRILVAWTGDDGIQLALLDTRIR